jgi:hypothetical protein
MNDRQIDNDRDLLELRETKSGEGGKRTGRMFSHAHSLRPSTQHHLEKYSNLLQCVLVSTETNESLLNPITFPPEQSGR